MSSSTLPEGTDRIVEDAEMATDIDHSGAIPMDNGALADAEAAADEAEAPADAAYDAKPIPTAREAFADARQAAGEKAESFRGQATDTLRAYAVSGKDKATESLHGFAKMVDDAATQIDEKIGGQYGGYARQAAQTLAGFAANLEEKDVDELFDQGRDLVRKSPGVAIGIAAALGFVVARVARTGFEAAAGATDEKDVDVSPDPTPGGGR